MIKTNSFNPNALCAGIIVHLDGGIKLFTSRIKFSWLMTLLQTLLAGQKQHFQKDLIQSLSSKTRETQVCGNSALRRINLFTILNTSPLASSTSVCIEHPTFDLDLKTPLQFYQKSPLCNFNMPLNHLCGHTKRCRATYLPSEHNHPGKEARNQLLRISVWAVSLRLHSETEEWRQDGGSVAEVGELAAKKAAGQDRLRTHPLSLALVHTHRGEK